MDKQRKVAKSKHLGTAMAKEKKVCFVEGCGKILGPRNTIGYCRKHRGMSPIVRAKAKVYRKDHKEEIHRKDRNWRKKNKVHWAAYMKQWAADHKEERAEYIAEYGKKYQKTYYTTDRGKQVRRLTHLRRREKELGLGEHFGRLEENAVFESFNHSCFNCGSKERLEVDHFCPLSKNNVLSLDNVTILCKHCNASKGTKKPEEFFTPVQIKRAKKLMKKAAKLYAKLKKQGSV